MKFLPLLLTNKLFTNFSLQELKDIITCLEPKQLTYKKNSCLLLAGSQLSNVGIVLQGKLTLQREDINGNITLVDEVHPGESFGEAIVCAGIQECPMSIWAFEKTEVLFLDYERMLTMCPSSCNYHSKLLANLLAELAQKLISLNQKLEIVQKVTIRDKLVALFSSYAAQGHSQKFTLSFTRKELAEYLGINRSAMSRELSRMQEDGLLSLDGKHVTLLNTI